jgi:hypothetical protein
MRGKQLAEFSDSVGLYRQSAVLDYSAQQPRDTGEYDAGFDFPPMEHPGRELFTFSLFVLAILTFLVWGGWALITCDLFR